MLQESTSSSLLSSPLYRRLSVYNWNPGPRRGTEDAMEKQIAGKWHLVTLQEASDYVNHAVLHERFHVTHFAGCAVLFNKDTFHPDIDVKSKNLHDTRRRLQLHPVAKQPSPFSLCTSTMFLPSKDVLPRKSSRLFVLL